MISVFIRPLLALLIVLAAAMPQAGLAQGLGRPGGETGRMIADQRQIMDDIGQQIDRLQAEIDRERENDSRLVEIRLRLEELLQQLEAGARSFDGRLSQINARLEQLGPPPAEGQPAEPDIVTSEREILAAEKAEINATVGVGQTLTERVSGLIGDIAAIRRDLFQNLLTKRYHIDYALAGEVVSAAKRTHLQLYETLSSWLGFALQFKLRAMLGATFLAFGTALVMQIASRRLFGPILKPNRAITDPSYLSRLSVAFWSTLLSTAALSVFFALVWLLYDSFGVLRGDVGQMLAAFFYVAVIVYYVHALGSAALSPGLPAWRLIPVEDRAARPLLALLSATAIFNGLDYFLGVIYAMMAAPLALTIGKSLVANVITGLLVIMIARVKPFADADGRPKCWPLSIRVLLYVIGAAAIMASLAGYIGLARFISQQIVVTGAIVATMYIGFQSTRAMSDEGSLARTFVGRRLVGSFGFDDAGLEKFGLFCSIVINLLIVAVGLPFILLQWGFQPGDIQAWVQRLEDGIQLGGFTFSPGGFLTGAVIFALGYFLTRWFQAWLDGRVLARGRVDAGVRNSIRLVVGYAGLSIAALLAVSAAGINLSSLALVAGALSVGIGFGLQNIVNNFVSGLILLVERPFKVGDWIVAGSAEGIVKKISVRATEIETFRRQTVMLPNSELINSAVGNWTHRNRVRRLDIPVVAAAGADPRKVHALLQEIARAQPQGLKNPEPVVSFDSVGDLGMKFQVMIYLADLSDGGTVQNEVLFSIVDTFEREGVEIAFLPRQVQPKARKVAAWPSDDDRSEAEHVERAARAQAAKPKPGRRRRRPDPA
jgi:small-conductance mechanosensitive channel